MNVLVTGCAGFIGSHLVEFLLSNGNDVIGIDNLDPFYDPKIKLRNLAEFKNHKQFLFIQGDICETSTYNKISDKIDLVVHLAAKAGVRPSIQDPIAYTKTNVLGTQVLLNWMNSKKVSKLVFASSSSVYGNSDKVPFIESCDVNRPISPYAMSKKACELMTYTSHHLSSMDVINLRFFTVFGPRQRPDLAIHKFIDLINNNQSITLYGDGSTFRDYTFVEDLIKGIQGAMDYLENNNGVYEIINLGSNNPIKLSEMVKIIYQVLDKEENVKNIEKQPGDVDGTYASIDKAKNILNYCPETSFEQGIRKFIAWHALEK